MAGVVKAEVECLQKWAQAAWERCRVGIEIGVRGGRTTSKMSWFIEAELGGGVWFGVDPWYRIEVPIRHPNVALVRMKSRDFAAVSDFKASIVFIDACHCFRCCSDDIDAWAPRVIRGGVVAFHDADKKNDGRDEPHPFHAGDNKYGVRRAIEENEFLQANYRRVDDANKGRLVIYQRTTSPRSKNDAECAED